MPAFPNLNAPILPDQEIGGITLRTRLTEIQQHLTGLGLYQQGRYALVSPFEARYTLGRGEVELAVDVRNGKLFKIIAKEGYAGLLFGSIHVNMVVRDAMRHTPALFYNEPEAVIMCQGIAGVAINVSEDDPDPDTVYDMPIDAISVYIAELDTSAGQLGTW